MYLRPDKLANVEQALVRARKRRASRPVAQPHDPNRLVLMGEAIKAAQSRFLGA